MDDEGRVFVVEGLYDVVNVFDPNGRLLLTFGAPGRAEGSFWLATGLAVDRRGRIFVAAILIVTFVISLFVNRSIFKLGIWSFTGFASLFPVVVAALFWRRSTKTGALASILSVAVLWTWFLVDGWSTPNYPVGGTGIMPAAVILAVSATAMIVVSLLTRPPDRAIVDRFFRPALDGSER